MGPETVGQRQNGNFDRSWRNERWGGQSLVGLAQQAARADQTMSITDAIHSFSKAIGWSVLLSTCVIMEGYDTNLLGNLLAFPSFQRQFGDYVGVTQETPSGYQIQPAWAAALGQSSNIGTFFGVLLNGYLTPRYGSRKVIVGALATMSVLLLIPFFACSVQVLLVGPILSGLTWGIFATTAPAYASEVLPTALRTYLTSYTNMCFVIGNLISAGVLRIFSSRIDQWGYRIPFALQWIWPAFLIPAICIAPESPWFLVRQGRIDEAEKSLRRLRSHRTSDIELKRSLATIVYTNNLEEQLFVGTSYWDCFRGFEIRRTEVACLCSAGQILSGICFGLNNSYFFEAIGLGTETTYSLALGGTALGLVGTLVNWLALMPHFGRRTIYIWGMACMSFVWLLVGVLNVWTEQSQVAMVQAVLSLSWTFIFQLSVSQLGWAFPAEIGSTRLRQKTICLARTATAVTGTLCGILQQYMLNTNKAAGGWNLRGYAGLVWCSTAFVITIWAFFRLPETWKRSYHELDILFAKGIPARKMASTMVDSFDEDEADRLAQQYTNSDSVRRPKFVPSVSAAIVEDPAELAQRRARVFGGGESRRASIAGSVTSYVHR